MFHAKISLKLLISQRNLILRLIYFNADALDSISCKMANIILNIIHQDKHIESDIMNALLLNKEL